MKNTGFTPFTSGIFYGTLKLNQLQHFPKTQNIGGYRGGNSTAHLKKAL